MNNSSNSVLNKVKAMSMETYFIGLAGGKKEDLLKWARGVRAGTINPDVIRGPFSTPQELQMREHFINMTPQEKDALISAAQQDNEKIKGNQNPLRR